MRTLLVSAASAAVVAVAWLRLERPREDAWRAVALVALALAASSVRPCARRAAGVVAAFALAAWLAFGLSPLDARPFDSRHDFFGPLGSRFANGFLDFYDTRLAFDPRLHADMHGVVLAAVFGFALAVGLLVAARRPVAAVLALLVGAGWPATLLGPSHALLVGTAILVAALLVLGGATERRVARTAVPALAAVALAAAALASSPAVAKQGVLAWQRWDPYTRPPSRVSVSFVWSSQYLGIRFPRRKTTVLEVAAPRTASLYWRAAVLDDFVDGDWVLGSPRGADSLEPPAAYERRNQTKQTVTVRALADTRLVGGGAPIRFDAGRAPIVSPQPGFASLPSGLARGFRYTVWSYAPQPSPAQLRRAPARYPRRLRAQGLLDVEPGVAMPAFGTPDRARRAAAVLAEQPALAAYTPVARLASAVAGKARTPYDAAVALERWLRSTGGFRYASRPPLVLPPLVGFLTRTRTGYCQHFAGAMALMLRYLGIPARVAVGFSSGRYDRHRDVWVVTDHDAHAWVEAWFAGYGWLPFDPTPAAGRPEQGALSAPYSASSLAFAARSGGGAGGAPGASPPRRQNAHRHGERGVASRAGRAPASAAPQRGSGARDALLALLALLLAACGGAVAVAKLALRLARARSRDPRRVGAACRRALAAYLVDQRIEAARSATLHELGEIVRRELAVDPARFVAAATAARFGRPERAGRAAHEAQRELRALLRAIRGRLAARERLRGLLSPRSLGFAP